MIAPTVVPIVGRESRDRHGLNRLTVNPNIEKLKDTWIDFPNRRKDNA